MIKAKIGIFQNNLKFIQMKKVIGTLFVAIFSMALFINTDIKTDTNWEYGLADLVKTAKAEYDNGDGASGFLGEAVLHSICHTVTVGGGVIPGSYTYQDCYDEWQCDGWFGWCY